MPMNLYKIYIDHPIIKHHKAQDTSANIHSAIKPFIKPEQVGGGSYDGPYHHAKEDVPLLLNRIMGIPDEDTHSDHDYLHRCGIYEKNEEAQELAEEMNIEFSQPKFHSDTRFSNHASMVFKGFYNNIGVFIKHYEQIKSENENSNL